MGKQEEGIWRDALAEIVRKVDNTQGIFTSLERGYIKSTMAFVSDKYEQWLEYLATQDCVDELNRQSRTSENL